MTEIKVSLSTEKQLQGKAFDNVFVIKCQPSQLVIWESMENPTKRRLKDKRDTLK